MGVNAFTAASYCRYLGKELPTPDQWLKALRGGLVMDGAPNPRPTRMSPRGTPSSKWPANLLGESDGFHYMAPVGSFPDDASPYGVLDLAGNVSEWSSEEETWPEMRGLRVVLGANWGSPSDHADWRNQRPDRYLDFAIGIRCVRT